MTYAESLQFLMGLLDPERYPRLQSRQGNLARIARLLSRLGHPERGLTTVLVGGTKGKGSTAAMLAAVQQAAGRRVGLYVKPHLVDYRERIRTEGALIGPADLAALMERVRPHVEAGGDDPEGFPTYFDVSVALALLHFRARDVDLAILEVGLGGRLDATNVCDPILSVITPISYDHTDVLGHTLEAIASEKAGIIRPNRPVVTAPQEPEADETVQAACAEMGARLVRAADRARWVPGEMSAAGQRFALRGEQEYGWLRLPLVGRHQAVNAAAAVVAAEELAAAGFPFPTEAVRAGLGTLQWPARVEVVREHPAVVVDVAHNEASMRALRDALAEVFPGRRLILVYGMVATHDHHRPTAVIAPLAEVAVVTVPRHVHALPAADLAEVVRRYTPRVEVMPDGTAALDRALHLASADDVVCVTGSFFLAGAARASLLGASDGVAGRGDRLSGEEDRAAQEVAVDGAKERSSPSARSLEV